MCAVPSAPGGPAAGSGTFSAAALGVDLVVPALHHGPIMSLGDIRNLDYTILPCSHMQETKDFYLNAMGFPLVHDSERWVSFQVGSALLTLRPRGPGLAWEDGPIAPGSAAVHLGFRVPPHLVDACHEILQSKGVAILSPPRDVANWRHRALFFRDPEGNLIELYAEI